MPSESDERPRDALEGKERLYERARRLPPKERAAFLNAECGGDEALRAELESLIDHGDDAEAFMQLLGQVTDQPSSGADRVPLRLVEALSDRYRVEAEIGRGGMAIVYLAHDLRHKRSVALKVLRPELAALLGAERFLAEIETTASLQHPHILPLFDSGEADGFLYYVMPHVDGESLGQRLTRERQVPVEEAVTIAVKVAGALEYAHRRGVIHRDIKPANILMSNGEPVVADFGIALAVSAADETRLTGGGPSLGTPHYLSPERAGGDPRVGPPTDVWALACVLFEMLVGDPPHMGSQTPTVLAKVMTEPAPHASRLRRTVPANVDAAIRRALEKVPADRFPRAKAFARALTDPHFRHGGTTGGRRGASTAIRPVAVAAVLAISLAAGWSWWDETPGPAVERFTLDLDYTGLGVELLPDGSGVVFARDGQLHVRRWEHLAATPIPGTGGAYTLTLSPNGDSVAFVAGRRRLSVASLAGGDARALGDGAFCCLRWAPDGYIYYANGEDIWRIPTSGGPSELFVARDGNPVLEYHHYNPVVRGDVVVYSALSGGSFRIEALRPSSGERTVLTPGLRPELTDAGHLVFASANGQLMAAPFDANAMKLSTPPIPVVDDITVRSVLFPQYDLSASGTLIYRSGRASVGGYEFVWVTRQGEVTPVNAGESFNPNHPGNGNFGWSLSPDGKRIAFQRTVETNSDIWIKTLPDGPFSRLTFHEAGDVIPAWTPDGTAVTFVSYRSSGAEEQTFPIGSLWSKSADGSGQAELVLDGSALGERGVLQHAWSPDRTGVVLRRNAFTNDLKDLFLMRPGGERADPTPLVATPAYETAPALSPDGRWLAYNSDETGQFEVYVRPFPNTGDGRWQVSDGGGSQPVWSRNGQELYFIDNQNGTLEAAGFSTDEGAFEPGPITTLFRFPPDVLGGATSGNGYVYDVAPDGRFLMARRAEPNEPPGPVILVQNFADELQRRLPQ